MSLYIMANSCFGSSFKCQIQADRSGNAAS